MSESRTTQPPNHLTTQLPHHLAIHNLKPSTFNPTTFNDWREYRRFRAWELKQQGWSQTRIAAALGVTGGAVSQWFKKVR